MKKIGIGLLAAGLLGALDGLTALLSAPETRPEIAGIVMGSTIKGLMVGVAAGFFARKFRSVPVGVAFGLGVGFALALLVAVMQGKYYLEIVLPGSAVGAIVGFATQRYGQQPARIAQPA
jgi:hypothetical protein